MLTIYKRDKYIKRVKGEFTPLEWILILKALNRLIHDNASHVDDVRMAKKIVSMEEKFVDESDTKQEQFINKPCVSEQACREDKVKVLEKIKAEIEAKCCITVGRDCDGAITLHDVFEIIDRYMKESEE